MTAVDLVIFYDVDTGAPLCFSSGPYLYRFDRDEEYGLDTFLSDVDKDDLDLCVMIEVDGVEGLEEVLHDMEVGEDGAYVPYIGPFSVRQMMATLQIDNLQDLLRPPSAAESN